MSRSRNGRSGGGEIAFLFAVVAMVVIGGLVMVREYREMRAQQAAATPTSAAAAPEAPRMITVEEAKGILPDVPETPLLHAQENLKLGMTKEEATKAVLAVAERECDSRTYFTWEHPFVRESPFRHYINGSSGPTEPVTEYRWLYHRTTREQGNGDHYWGSLTAIFCGEELEEWWYRSWWEVRGIMVWEICTTYLHEMVYSQHEKRILSGIQSESRA